MLRSSDEVTGLVFHWLRQDRQVLPYAVRAAHQGPNAATLGEYLAGLIEDGTTLPAAGVRHRLSDRELKRVNWAAVALWLIDEGDNLLEAQR